jgi:hypothetical protein
MSFGPSHDSRGAKQAEGEIQGDERECLLTDIKKINLPESRSFPEGGDAVWAYR